MDAYVLDLWAEQWKRRHATGHVRLVRYADDYLLMFKRRQDAEAMTAALVERLAKFGLHLHEDKTRLIEFGRFANRRRKGRARPEVFDFLGFTHYCGKTRDGRFLLCQKTQGKRMIRKLKELPREMRGVGRTSGFGTSMRGCPRCCAGTTPTSASRATAGLLAASVFR